MFWQVFSDSLFIRRSVDAVLADVRRHAGTLCARARQIEERSLDR